MDNKNYKKRIIDSKIDLYLDTFGAVLIEGPKWCGKTWTGHHHCQSEFLLSDPKGNFGNRQLASIDPELALKGKAPRLIDEWQEVPSIWDAVRSEVDADQGKGRFILTGSSAIDKSSYIHTGTGRIAHLRMRTMSLYEEGISTGKVSLRDICLGNHISDYNEDISLQKLIGCILKGGFPGSMGLSVQQGMLIAKEYMKSVISEDIDKVGKAKRDKRKVQLLLRSLARNEATTASKKTLIGDISEKDGNDISIDALSDYLNLLNDLYLIEEIPPFSSNIRSSLRVKQSAKRHFVDPSLPASILNLTEDKLLGDPNTLGFLFESMVERELLTYVDAFGGKLFHYQDYKDNEIDAIIESPDGSWCGIEIKLGGNQIDKAAENLLRINGLIVGKGGKGAKSLCVIAGVANAAYQRQDGVYVVPITSLKD